MKIGTDAVALGVVANHANPSKILDIGTGSGIIAYASPKIPRRKCYSYRDRTDAYSQACENINASPFEISCVHESFQDYSREMI